MRALILVVVVALGTLTMFTGCERNDYQHPGYRSGKYK
jgi:hypothetical protein